MIIISCFSLKILFHILEETIVQTGPSSCSPAAGGSSPIPCPWNVVFAHCSHVYKDVILSEHLDGVYHWVQVRRLYELLRFWQAGERSMHLLATPDKPCRWDTLLIKPAIYQSRVSDSYITLCPPWKGPVSDFTRDACFCKPAHLCMHPLKKQCICLSIYQSPVLYAVLLKSRYMYYFCSDFFHGVHGIPRRFPFWQFGSNSLWF